MISDEAIFVRLNPILRLLCDAVKAYNTATTTKTAWDERHFQMVRTIAELLEELERRLQGLLQMAQSSSSDKETRSVVIQSTIRTMLDYVTLPSLTLLRSQDRSTTRVWDWTDPLLQSAVWKCLDRACRVLQVTIKLVGDERNGVSLTKRNLYLETTIGCLPTGTWVVERGINTDTITTTTTKSPRRLDHGDDCITRLLTLIGTLVTDPIPEPWLARILDCSVALVEPPKSSPSDRTVPYSVQTRALDTMERCLTAWSSRTTISKKSADPGPWRRVFPGLYAGLYRGILSSIREAHVKAGARTVVVRSVEILVHLFSVSMARQQQQRALTTSTDSVIDALQALSSRPNSNDECGEDTPLTPEDEFFRQIHERLPPTLTVLINMLTGSQSGKVRGQVISLDRIVLEDSQHWDDSLTTTAFESCLILSQDCDSTVSTKSYSAIRALVKGERGTELVLLASERLVLLIERVASLAHSERDSELRASLKTISGYLSLGAAQLRPTLLSEGVSATLRRAFGTLFDCDWDSSEAPSHSVVMIQAGEPPSRPRFKHMGTETTTSALAVAVALGRTLGPKQVTVWTDACVSDMYDSCLRRVERRVSLTGQSQVAWIHDWMGVVILVEHLVLGGFESTPGNTNHEKKRLRFLHAFAKSILPVLVSYPLWELPSREIDSRCTRFVNSDSPRSLHSTNKITAQALRGNAAFIGNLLHVVGTMIELLGAEAQCYAPVLLYPILEKAGHAQVPAVKNAAFLVLESFANSCVSTDVYALIADNMESSLMGSMLSRCRVPGGKSLSKEQSSVDYSILTVVDCATTVLRIGTEAQLNRPSAVDGRRSMLSYMEELTQDLTTRFDYAAADIANDTIATMMFLRLFDAAVAFLRASRETTEDTKTPAASTKREEPWMEVLQPYRKKQESTGTLTPGEGFGLYNDGAKIVMDTKQNIESNVAVGLLRDVSFISHIAWRCGYLLSHSNLYIQNQSINVLIQAFMFLRWLAKDGAGVSEMSNGPQTAVFRQVHASWTAISARFKATCTTVARFKETSLRVFSPELANGAVASSTSGNIAEQRIFLAKLFELIASMTECADDFMATRVREVVYPCLQLTLRSSRSYVASHSVATRSSAYNPNRADSERLLLISTIRCLGRLFGHQPTGLILSGSIASMGAELFPFLAEPPCNTITESIPDATMLALRRMIDIDCDALWTMLVRLAGRPVPKCPYPWKTLLSQERQQRDRELPHVNEGNSAEAKSVPDSTHFVVPEIQIHTTSHSRDNASNQVSLQCRRAQELLDYIDSLPEQRLD